MSKIFTGRKVMFSKVSVCTQGDEGDEGGIRGEGGCVW